MTGEGLPQTRVVPNVDSEMGEQGTQAQPKLQNADKETQHKRPGNHFSTPDLQGLPAELRQMIFSYFSIHELARHRNVCKSIREDAEVVEGIQQQPFLETEPQPEIAKRHALLKYYYDLAAYMDNRKEAEIPRCVYHLTPEYPSPSPRETIGVYRLHPIIAFLPRYAGLINPNFRALPGSVNGDHPRMLGLSFSSIADLHQQTNPTATATPYRWEHAHISDPPMGRATIDIYVYFKLGTNYLGCFPTLVRLSMEIVVGNEGVKIKHVFDAIRNRIKDLDTLIRDKMGRIGEFAVLEWPDSEGLDYLE
ncbi:hypothetical protein K491DRAFT_677920 [Lophiostoma macrostomum CBS 122681]|uniref:F-box domain-containing protein n=1 Tax=Lophiostoma macrostomum CBS 122681 TaxID=1314788 RepID=A0A6A6TDC0_9PLEO|nr:hypothetical protein K491DRAFT_677920 [Lophiostoma macrostomum CBS 122681]